MDKEKRPPLCPKDPVKHESVRFLKGYESNYTQFYIKVFCAVLKLLVFHDFYIETVLKLVSKFRQTGTMFRYRIFIGNLCKFNTREDVPPRKFGY